MDTLLPLWVKSSRSVSKKFYHLSGWYWGEAATRHSMKRRFIQKINVNDLFIKVDTPECLLFPGADIGSSESGDF
jgi:hypothetical protein